MGQKRGNYFDVTMDTYDRAEVCKLVGNFLLSLLSEHVNKNPIGLHRNDALAILNNRSRKTQEKDLDSIVQ